MAAEASLFKFLKPRVRPQPTDIQAAALWGVAATTTALWLVQPFDWLRRTLWRNQSWSRSEWFFKVLQVVVILSVWLLMRNHEHSEI